MDLEKKVNQNFQYLNSDELQCLNFIIEHKDSVGHLTLNEISKLCHVSASFLFRTIKKVGYSGFSELKYEIKKEENKLKQKANQPENIDYKLNEDIEKTIKYFNTVNHKEMYGSIKEAKRIFSYGTGWEQKMAAEKLTRNFIYSKKFVTNFPALEELSVAEKALNEKDIVFLISLSGNNERIVSIAKDFKRRNIKTISFTQFGTNQLAGISTYNLYYYSSEFSKLQHRSIVSLFILVELFSLHYKLFTEQFGNGGL
ncbi:MurR/RpiR family transcriptional regulator [Heyndrickxia acidiproducens]|uniref:MurR/RpiR family transcriptional regulator n=1 Tax=Heyndrickxia acidiproducens TaxID=1121084 RepID=UPI000377DAB4|nr:MurR/RpiR family transcriptional regulator [Heyndrickxia acidiproducens]